MLLTVRCFDKYYNLGEPKIKNGVIASGSIPLSK